MASGVPSADSTLMVSPADTAAGLARSIAPEKIQGWCRCTDFSRPGFNVTTAWFVVMTFTSDCDRSG
jgi:hypothetical protein